MNRQEALSSKRNYPYVFYAVLLPFVAGMEEPKVVTVLLYTHVSSVSTVLCIFLSKSNAMSVYYVSTTIVHYFSIVHLYS